MKLLLVNNDKGWGGGQEHLRTLADEFRKYGITAHFLVRPGSPSERVFTEDGFAVHPCSGSGFKGSISALFKTAALLRRGLYDVVVVEREHDLLRTVLARFIAFPFRKYGRLIVCYHTATARRQFFLNQADAVVCISEFVRKKLINSNRRIVPTVNVINNGIPVNAGPDTDKFSLLRQRRFFKGVGFPLIGMIGAFFKNQGELMEIVPLLKREFPDIKVALVGDDSDTGLTGPLRERARYLGVENSIIFTGAVAHDLMADIYFDLDLSVSTFRNEGFGLVHLESMAAGTPVVTFDEGGQVDIFRNNDAGILVSGGPDSFAAAVTSLLHDHERRFAMGRAGFRLVKSSWTAREMGKKYYDLFRKLAKR